MGVDLSQGGLPAVPERPSGPIQAIEDALNQVNGVGQKFAEGMVGLFGMIRDAMFGNYTGDIPELVVIQDGMTDLNDKVEVLDDVPGYAGAYMLNNHRFGSGSSWKTIPFNARYGPSKKADLDPATHRMTLETGSWSVHFTVSTAAGTGSIGHAARVRIRDHTGTVVITRVFEWQNGDAVFGAPAWDQHYAMPVIATEDGWSAELAYRHSGLGWHVLGGTARTVLWVERKNIDTANAEIVTDVPDGPDIP